MRLRSALLVATLATLGASGAVAQTSVRDSVRMTLGIYQYANVTDDGGYTCGAGVFAIWPNVLQSLLGTPDRTYGYRDYGRVATDGMYIPSGYGEAKTNPDVGLVVPGGFVGHNPQLGGGGYSLGGGDGSIPASCGNPVNYAQTALGGGWGTLNASPFRITEWYATFSVPDGTPIALFEWEEGDGRAIRFDGGFRSLRTGDALSREIDATVAGGKIPVASYAWAFGDGDRGTGARPEHVYDEDGDYDVTLTVTDDDGQTNAFTATVHVEGAHLTVTVRAETETAGKGDEITVVATVQNSGDEPVFAVSMSRVLTYAATLPDSLDVEGSGLIGLRLEPVDALGPATWARMDPGESHDVRIAYGVREAAERLVPETGATEPADAEVRWVAPLVTGETPTDGTVPIRQPCRDGGCDNLTVVEADAPFTTEIVFSNVTGEVTEAPAGRQRRRRDDGRFEVNHRFATLGQPAQCISGCVDVEVVVTDEAGQPVEGAAVQLRATPVAGAAVVTPDQGGGFFCPPSPNEGDCGTAFDALPTDAEGRSRALYWFPGLVASARTTVTARVTVDGEVDSQDAPLTLLPTRVEFGHDTVTPTVDDAAFLTATGSVLAATHAVASLPGLCGKGLAYVGSAGGRVTPLDQGFVKGTKAASDWVCGKFQELLAGKKLNGRIGEVLALVTAAKELSKLAQVTWFFTSFNLSDVGLASVTLEAASPPFLGYESDFVDGITEAFAKLSARQYVDGVVTPLTLEIHEVSYAKRDGGGVEFVPALYVRLRSTGADAVDSKKLVRAGYTPASWLTEEGIATATTAAPVAAGDTSVPLGPPAPGRLASPQADEPFRPGHVLVLDPGTDIRETVQVAAVADGRIDLTTALRHAHAAGAVMSRIDSLGTDAPDAPSATSFIGGFAGAPATPTLTWITRAPAATYQVEVATDSLFTSVVAGAEALADPAFTTPPLADGRYYWRVRAAHDGGTSPWSARAAFVVGRTPGDDLAAAVELAGPLPLVAAEWTFEATTEANEATPSCGSEGGSVWFRLTPPVTGRLSIDTYGSTFDTALSVWSGTGHPLTEVACDEGTFESPVAAGLSRVMLDATAGTPLYVRVSGREAGAAVVWVEAAGGVAVEPDEAPTVLGLGSPFPNPAQATATVAVGLPEAGAVRLAVYDALGREVAVGWDAPMSAGRHPVALDTSRLPAGVYVVRLQAGAQSAVQRLTVVR